MASKGESNFPVAGDNSHQLNLQAIAAAQSLSSLQGFTEFNLSKPESAMQGALECLYEIQQICCCITGLDAVSLASLTGTQAIFASLSMISKYHQRKKQSRRLLLSCVNQPELIYAAQLAGFEVMIISVQDIEESLNSQVAAIITFIPSLQDKGVLADSLMAKLEAMDVLIYRHGCGQYFLPVDINEANAQVDVLSLDVGHYCELDIDCYAVLSNSKLTDYLPLPLVAVTDNKYHLQTLQQNPLSIGPLNVSAGNLEAIIQCYVHLRLKGMRYLQQQALKAVVTVSYLMKELTDAGFGGNCQSLQGSGECDITMAYSAPLLTELEELQQYTVSGMKSEILVNKEQNLFSLKLKRLHYLSKKQLDSLIQLIIKLC